MIRSVFEIILGIVYNLLNNNFFHSTLVNLLIYGVILHTGFTRNDPSERSPKEHNSSRLFKNVAVSAIQILTQLYHNI